MKFLTRRTLLTIVAVLAITGLSITAEAQSPGGYQLEGSYVLDRASSEDSASILESVADREGATANELSDLESKLEAPETVRIEIDGKRVTLKTSMSSSPVTFFADGIARSSQRPDGSSVSVKAGFRGQELTISSLGGESDYTLIFIPVEGGRSMRVTRRITTSYLRETVFADSIYRRSDDLTGQDAYGDDRGYSSSDSGGYSDSAPVYAKSQPGRNGSYAVPAGTTVTGVLENLVTTKASQENDRFRITVESPEEFRGAVIEGYLTGIERTGKVSGRSKVTFNFETITMADGRTYDFAGVLQGITDTEGDDVAVNDEGEVRSKSRTAETAKRSGIGAGLGAIIGGIFGGGKGAIIGATVGAGAGAGSMIPGGRDDLELEPGTKITIQTTGPAGR